MDSFHFKELNRIYKVLSTRSSEKAMATHSSILARKIPWAEGPDGLQSMGLQSWTHLRDWTTTTSSYHLTQEIHLVCAWNSILWQKSWVRFLLFGWVMWNYQYLSALTYKNWQLHVIQPNNCHQGSYGMSLTSVSSCAKWKQ